MVMAGTRNNNIQAQVQRIYRGGVAEVEDIAVGQYKGITRRPAKEDDADITCKAAEKLP